MKKSSARSVAKLYIRYTEMRPRWSTAKRGKRSTARATGGRASTTTVFGGFAVARARIARRRRFALDAERRAEHHFHRLPEAFGAVLHARVEPAGSRSPRAAPGARGRGRRPAPRASAASTTSAATAKNESGAVARAVRVDRRDEEPSAAQGRKAVAGEARRDRLERREHRAGREAEQDAAGGERGEAAALPGAGIVRLARRASRGWPRNTTP